MSKIGWHFNARDQSITALMRSCHLRRSPVLMTVCLRRGEVRMFQSFEITADSSQSAARLAA
ncbi:MAG: hypothetical protein AAFY66_11655, partial [Pseudomonadota bacterium]